MKVTQEKLPASQIGLDIEITPEMSKSAYEQVIQNYSRAANIPGFRRGKVPRKVLIQRLGDSRIKAAALEDLMQQYLPKVIEQENIPAIGSFELRDDIDDLISQFEPGKALTIKAAIDVEPEVKLGQYKGLSVKAEEVKFDPAQVDEVLEQERIRLATLIPVEGRPAQSADVAFVDFKGHFVSEEEGAEPEAIPGGQGDNFQVELGEGRFIPGFIEGIIGMNPGETKEISAQFPEDYNDETAAGRPAVFTVTLKELKERELPELDDEFAEEVSDFSTLAELRESLETRYKKEKEDKTTNNKQQALAEALVEGIEVDLPETLVRQEVDQLLTQQAMQLSNMGLDIKKLFTQDMIPRFREQARSEAILNLKRSLALKEVAKVEGLTVTDEEIKAEEAVMMEQLKGQSVDPERLRAFVTEDLLRKKTYSWLEENSTIELVPEGTLKPDSDSEEQASEAEGEMEAEAVTVEVLTDETAE